ncbi:MAG: 2Fe-2S iron-sulfur cluster-binding protein, partial [Flavobacteriales bacterium]
LLKGRIDKDKCDALNANLLQDRAVDEVFICGPSDMIHAAKDSFAENGVPSENIHFELFTSPLLAAGEIKKEQVVEPKHSGPVSKVKIILDDQAMEFDLPYDGENVLDAALGQGADLPFACKGGVCCTCRAKLIKGEVEMDLNYSLEPDEVAAGFILTCQSHPKTDEVVIDFDQQ